MSLPTCRPYQLAAVKAVVRELAYRDSTLIVQATGTGKSVVQGALARILLRRGCRRVLVTAPRLELLEQNSQWAARWQACAPAEIGFEQGERRSHAGHRVVYATLATLRDDARLATMPAWDAVIHDEAHIETEALRRLAAHRPAAKRVGMTATPDRSDLDRLLPHPFEAIHGDAVYEIREAIEDGHLAPIEGVRVHVGALDLKKVRLADGGDFADRSLSAQMRSREVLEQCALATLREARGQTLIFATSLEHARDVVELLRAWGDEPAEVAHGNLPSAERRAVLRRFAEGEVRYLVTVALLTYGWDCPVAETAVMLRPTKSRSLWTQCVGRVLRPYPGKESALVLDFWGGSEDLELVTPDEAMMPMFDAPRRRQLAAAAPGEAEAELEDLLAGGDEGGREVGDRPEVAYRLEALNEDLRPLGIELEATGSSPLTRRTEIRLAERGVDGLDLSEEQAAELLGKLADRQRAGGATYLQMRTLARFGLNPLVPFDLAREVIGAAKSNGWKVPRRLRLDPRLAVAGRHPIILKGGLS